MLQNEIEKIHPQSFMFCDNPLYVFGDLVLIDYALVSERGERGEREREGEREAVREKERGEGIAIITRNKV